MLEWLVPLSMLTHVVVEYCIAPQPEQVRRSAEDMLMRHAVSPIMTSWNYLCSVVSNFCGGHWYIAFQSWAPNHPNGAPPDGESGTFQWEKFRCV